MSIAKPFTFVANTHAKSSEVNANFDTVYSQVNTNISAIAQNATDIDNLENNKADINGSTAQRFAVADAITDSDAINKQTLFKAIGNSVDYISGFTITKDSGSPEDTIIVSAGSAYDSTKSVVLSLANSLSKQNTNQAANATYYVYVIGSSTGSSVDILISPNQVTPTLPTGYSLFRQIGSYTTDGDNKISSISYYGESDTSDKSIGTVLNAIMPDYTSGINFASGYVAPSAGWAFAYLGGIESTATGHLYINGVIAGMNYCSDGGFMYSSQYALVDKGDVITADRVNTLTFFPLKGAN